MRKAGNRLRITAQLINVADGFHLWSERYDREMTDVFAVQDEITQSIVRALMPKMASEQPRILVKTYTGNIEAYELCLRGRYHWQKYTPDGFGMGLKFFGQALEQDAENPLAYAGLAKVYRLLGYFGGLRPREAMLKAKAAVSRAIQLDDTLVEAHVSLANVLYFYDWDWAGAEREFRRGLELDPRGSEAHCWFGFFLWARGRYEESLDQFHRALEADPFSILANWFLGLTLISLGRHADTPDLARKMLTMDPSFWGGHHLSAVVKLTQGRHAEAVKEYEHGATIERGPVTLGSLCQIYSRAGRPDDARRALDQLQQMSQQRFVPPVWLAWGFDAVGDHEQAQASIQRALEERDAGLLHLRGWNKVLPGLVADCLGLLERAGL